MSFILRCSNHINVVSILHRMTTTQLNASAHLLSFPSLCFMKKIYSKVIKSSMSFFLNVTNVATTQELVAFSNKVFLKSFHLPIKFNTFQGIHVEGLLIVI